MKMTHLDRRNVLRLFGATATSSLAMTSASFAGIGNDEVASGRKRRFVLIHGAWQNATAWDGVVRVLRRAGHEVEAPTLPGMAPGDSQAGIEFSDYVDAVVEVLRRQHRKVTLVGHSSAGMLLQAAAPQAKNAIELMVFCNAFILAGGQNQLDNIPADAAAGLAALAQQNGGIVPFAPLEGFIRGALMEGDPIEKQDALLQILVDQPFTLFSTPVDTTAFEALDIPRAVVFCQRDHSADYLGMATRLGH